MRSPKAIVKKSQPIARSSSNKSRRQSAPMLGAGKGVQAAVGAAAGITICDKCKAVYYDKHWHAPTLLKSWLDLKGAGVGRCEACKDGQAFAGEVILEGLKDSLERDEILAVVRHAGNRSVRRNPEARVIGIVVTGARVRITTTDNQLAVAIGKQIHEARKGSELHVTWSSGDKPVRVLWRKVK